MAMSIYDHELPDITHNLYDVTFYQHTISTIVTNTPSYVDAWIAETERIHHRRLHSLVVGLDVEWRPNQSRNIENPVATLQLCVGRRCLIFQILHSDFVPQSLKNFLGNRNYTFTGVGIESDVEKLTEDYNLVVARMADVRTLAADAYGVRELKNAGIKALTERILGREVNKPKGITMSRWDNQWLTPPQAKGVYTAWKGLMAPYRGGLGRTVEGAKAVVLGVVADVDSRVIRVVRDSRFGVGVSRSLQS